MSKKFVRLGTQFLFLLIVVKQTKLGGNSISKNVGVAIL